MDIRDYNNFILEIKKNIGDLKRRVVEVKQRVIQSNNEDSSEIHVHVDATTKKFQEKLLENIENGLRDSEHTIEEELSYEDEAVNINNGKEAHPFTRNDLVLGIIFGFLNGDSLKQCRLVNHNWKKICEPYFMKKIQIATSDMKRFLLDFSGNSTLDCGRYKFRGQFIISDFQEILLKDLSMLTSLTLEHVQFYDNDGELDRCNLDDILRGNNIFLKKLQCKSTLVIPIERLVEIEYLDLHWCHIIFPQDYGGRICSPKYIKLVNISIIRPTGEKVEQILVNTMMNVRKAKEIIIFQKIYGGTSLNLSLEEPTEEFMKTVVVIGKVNILTNRLLKLKALMTDGREYDLSNLPESLECLFLSPKNYQNIQEYAISPNLKYLNCSFSELAPLLTKFSVCPQSRLKFVYLHSNYVGECDISWLPTSVETIILSNIQPTFRNERQLNVKDFILIDCPDNAILETLIKIKAENLYLSFKRFGQTEQNVQIVLQIYQQRYYGKTFKVGSFIWQDSNQFQNSPLFRIVDKRSGTYTFEKGLGKADNANFNEFANTMSLIRFYNSSHSGVESPRHCSSPHFFKPHWKFTD